MPSAIPGRNIVVAERGRPAAAWRRWPSDGCLPTGTFPNAAERAKAYEELFAQAASVAPGCEGLLFLPWLNG